MKQCIVIVLDSVGIGELPDADQFGDAGSDTLGHIAEAEKGLFLPNLQKLGLGNIDRSTPVLGCEAIESPIGAYGKLTEVSVGKDTTTGHWELMGLISREPFVTFPNGFPQQMLDVFAEKIGVKGVLGNMAASGTKIIVELGREHLATGKPIVYTSADSVLQIAVHEDLVPIEQLYHWCQVAFSLVKPLGISRVIARPFVGQWPNFTRTHRRKDFSIKPKSPTYLNELENKGIKTLGIGKIASIYAYSGVEKEVHTKNNEDGINETIKAMKSDLFPFVFTNLVDFDMLYGHRRDPKGYAACLRAFDARLPEIMDAMTEEDLLLLVADHGNDPTYRGTDHTREYVPVLAYAKWANSNVNLHTRSSFADVGRTILDYFGVSIENKSDEDKNENKSGSSFLSLL